jgi:hypothetical protein
MSCPVETWLNNSIIISVEDPETKQLLSIKPNPTAGLINISFGSTSIQEVRVELYNLQGADVLLKTFQSTTSETIDLTGHPAGMYLVKVVAGEKRYEEKIVKE